MVWYYKVTYYYLYSLQITPSPIFQIRVESPKSFKTSALENNGEDLSNSNSAAELFIGGNNQRWQIIPPVEASKAIAKHRVDPEQPILSLEPPPLVKKRPVSPFQIVGHVMSDEELKSFPDSPIGKAMPVTKNSSLLLFSSCHLKLAILENNRLLSENSWLFVKIWSKKSSIFW